MGGKSGRHGGSGCDKSGNKSKKSRQERWLIVDRSCSCVWSCPGGGKSGKLDGALAESSSRRNRRPVRAATNLVGLE